MKIEIPGYGSTTLDHLKDTVNESKATGVDKFSFTPDIIQGLINKIEDLQSDIDALGCEMDDREDKRHYAIHNS